MPADHAEQIHRSTSALAEPRRSHGARAILDRPVIIREWAPKDLKLEMEQFSRSEAATTARYLTGWWEGHTAER